MDNSNNDNRMLSIKDLLSRDQYMIPIYQRNFAWDEHNLTQLIQDVMDSCSSDRNYYIGTLVVYPRPNNIFETVDGQQRLTTLNIILCALRNELLDENQVGIIDWYQKVNISYEYRESSSLTLEALYQHDDYCKLQDHTIATMYDNVATVIDKIVPKEKFDQFLKFFLEKVKITRVILPADTDLNHYFEIMNNRGEQLEKHEILKSYMMSPFKDDPTMRLLISQIWDACKDMDRYLPAYFSPELRAIIFGNNWDACEWNDLKEILDKTKDLLSPTGLDESSIETILSDELDSTKKKDDDIDDRFNSVINFPNFLLQVLRIFTSQDIALDDKRLLPIFKDRINQQFVEQFIPFLLRLRFLFDRFIIKRDFKDTQDGKWNILYLKKQEKGYSYNIPFDEKENKRLVMIESAFHVSLPSFNYKHWLCAALNYLKNHTDGNGLIQYMESLAKGYMFGRFLKQDKDNDSFYFNLIFNQNGNYPDDKPTSLTLPSFTDHIEYFIFNYIDYCIWKTDPNKYANFEFTSRSSVEHFYPQHPMPGFPVLEESYLHNIGNLCLISSAKNSELSNYSPAAKTEHYKQAGFDSLKQKLMMDVVDENKKKSKKTEDVWWEGQIDENQHQVEQILLESFDSMGQ